MIKETLLLLPFVKTGIEQAWKYRRGKALAEKEEQEELTRAYELAVRLAGSVLFELRTNVERIRFMAELSKANHIAFSPFDLGVSDAIMPRLCEVLPTPAVLQEFHLALSAVRRADFFQRAGTAAPLIPHHSRGDTWSEEDTRWFALAVQFANDALTKGLLDRFNRLRDLCDGLGEAAFTQTWETVRETFLPDRIDPNGQIDHSML